MFENTHSQVKRAIALTASLILTATTLTACGETTSADETSSVGTATTSGVSSSEAEEESSEDTDSSEAFDLADIFASATPMKVEINEEFSASDIAVGYLTQAVKDMKDEVGNSIIVPADYLYKFADGTSTRTIDTLGDTTVDIEATDADGNSEVYTAPITVVDTKSPEIIGTHDWEVDLNSEEIDFLSGVSVIDNSNEDITAEVDFTAVNYTAAGDYKVTYKAEDSSGNKTSKSITVTVLEPETTTTTTTTTTRRETDPTPETEYQWETPTDYTPATTTPRPEPPETTTTTTPPPETTRPPETTPPPSTTSDPWVQMYGDPLGQGYDYWYWYNTETCEIRIGLW